MHAFSTSPPLRLSPEPEPAAATADSHAPEIAGIIRSRATGNGLRAHLTLLHEGVAETVLSDEDGRFRFHPSALGRYQLYSIEADGHLPFVANPLCGQIFFDVVPGLRTDLFDMSLEAARSVKIRVVDDGGNAIARARVHAFLSTGLPAPMPDELESDREGQLSLLLAADQRLTISHPAFVATDLTVDRLSWLGGALSVQLMHVPFERRPLAIGGHVIDESGRGVADAVVSLMSLKAPTALQTLTNDEGTFAIEVPDDREYTVTARVPHRSPAVVSKVHGGDGLLELHPEEGGSVYGRVTLAENGDPIRFFTLTLVATDRTRRASDGYYEQLITAGSGDFLLDGIAPGGYVARAYADGRAPSSAVEIKIAGPHDSVHLELAPSTGMVLSGRVLDAITHLPIARARVSTPANPYQDPAITDDNGGFVLEGVSEGNRTLLVEHDHHDSRTIADADEPIVIELQPIG
jgi:hypothetical protein